MFSSLNPLQLFGEIDALENSLLRFSCVPLTSGNSMRDAIILAAVFLTFKTCTWLFNGKTFGVHHEK